LPTFLLGSLTPSLPKISYHRGRAVPANRGKASLLDWEPSRHPRAIHFFPTVGTFPNYISGIADSPP
jgi:hypothetical protein